jgi:hypothetical protein
MVFSKKNAGKWVASKDGKVVAAAGKLQSLMKRVQKRSDKDAIRYDIVPSQPHFAGLCGIPVC